jgi:hypothetical protein
VTAKEYARALDECKRTARHLGDRDPDTPYDAVAILWERGARPTKALCWYCTLDAVRLRHPRRRDTPQLVQLDDELVAAAAVEIGGHPIEELVEAGGQWVVYLLATSPSLEDAVRAARDQGIALRWLLDHSKDIVEVWRGIHGGDTVGVVKKEFRDDSGPKTMRVYSRFSPADMQRIRYQRSRYELMHEVRLSDAWMIEKLAMRALAQLEAEEAEETPK